MKKLSIYSILLFTAIALFSMSSCSKDEDESESTTNKVVINTDGSTSNGSIFSAIDDKNFYLDYIKYTVEEGHLVVSGYDKAGFKDNAKIASSITYKQNTYEVLSIGDKAFNECTGLTNITIPNSVTRIAFYVFKDCTNLTSITISNSVTSIGNGIFENCPKLEKIVVLNGNTTFDSRDNCNAIIETATNTLLWGCKNSTIPNSVTSIGHSAFSNCTGLTSITIPNSVTSIGNFAFRYCADLTSITIPNSVTSIGEFAFDECKGLTAIHCLSTTPPTTLFFSYSSAFDKDTYKKATLYVPQGSLEAYKAAAGWTEFQNIVEE